MAKIPKMTLATRNPVFCELIRGFLRSRCDLSAKKSDLRSAFHRHARRNASAGGGRQRSRSFSLQDPELTRTRFSQVSALFNDYLPADIETIIFSRSGRVYFSSAFA